MQPAVLVTGVATQRFVRVPMSLPDELDTERVFVAANRVESLTSDCKALSIPWQRHLRKELDSYGAPSMSVGDFIVIRFAVSPIGAIAEFGTSVRVIDGRHVRARQGSFALIECTPSGWDTLLTESDQSLHQQAEDHWLTIVTKENARRATSRS